MKDKIIYALIFVVGILTSGAPAGAQERARADLKNAEGKSVGSAEFRQIKGGVLLTLRLNGLPPGLHAVHIHATGKCEPPGFTSAGGHFNPLEAKHGFKNPDGPHAGDLPDVLVNKDGVARYEALTQNVTLGAGKNSILEGEGRAIVIHAGADDHMTDPAGNSGDRIACGVINKAAPRKR